MYQAENATVLRFMTIMNNQYFGINLHYSKTIDIALFNSVFQIKNYTY